MYTPAATYRVQLNKEFTLEQLQAIVDYLEDLGISTIYASPLTCSGMGSMHGYDVTDPHTVDPEIGTLDTLKQLSTGLQSKQMGWLQDIVPNHMAFSRENKRLMDALERDAQSEFHGYFDIQWKHPEFKGKVMVPFLGEDLATCIEKGDIQLVLTTTGFVVRYHEQQYPLSLSAYRLLMSVFVLLAKGTGVQRDLNLLLAGDLPGEKYALWQQHKTGIFNRLNGHARNRKQVEDWLTIVNADKALLTQLLEVQYYKLCYWKDVNRVINYRRFFTISSLICLRMEAAPVFTDYHQFLHALYKENIIQGLRIDHIDGLYDPEMYVKRLRDLFGASCYIIAEKILEGQEELPASWLLQGTSGYEFLSEVNQLFTDRQGGARLSLFYQSLIPGQQSYSRQVSENKQRVLEQYMQGEWDNLVRYFEELQLAPYAANWKAALAAMMAALPVYRIYPSQWPLNETEQLILEETFAQAKQSSPEHTRELDYLQGLFSDLTNDPEKQARVLLFLKRMMQFTGPVMAKGVEDTTFYTYNALIAHNEVGDTPAVMGKLVGQFHARMKVRQAAAPLSLNATATHDTKRGEDARIRLNVLSEIPEEWEQQVRSWFFINEKLHTVVDGEAAPGRNDEYFIYQSIVGGFPEDDMVTDDWVQRLQEQIRKAIREAKVKTSWEEPYQPYEQACMDFVHHLFEKGHDFLRHILPLMKQIDERAAIYSLGQVLVKVTAPGIPDIYQGCELWDHSFVDPDNRRVVDYKRRKDYLEQIKAAAGNGTPALFEWLQTHRMQGLEKMFVTWKGLHFRKHNKELFTHGAYVPLHVQSSEPEAVAFARHYQEQWVIVVVPVNTGAHAPGTDSYVQLPDEAPGSWHNVLTEEFFSVSNRQIDLRRLWELFPVALLRSV